MRRCNVILKKKIRASFSAQSLCVGMLIFKYLSHIEDASVFKRLSQSPTD